MGISAFVTEVNKEIVLNYISYIYYLVQFKKDQVKIQTLIDFGNKVNIMNSAYAAKLGLNIQQTNINTQKIDGFILLTFEMIMAYFQKNNKLKKT